MAQIVMRTYLKQVIGLGDNQAGTVKANAFLGQGMDDITEIHEFAGTDEIKNLCNSVRKPGGQIANPDSVAANTAAIDANQGVAVANQAPVPPITMMSDPGHNVPAICEVRLTLSAYAAKIYLSIGRDISPATLSRLRLNEFRRHLSMVSNHSNPDPLPILSRSFGIMKFLDSFPSYLRETLGVSKIPLSYVLRDGAIPNPLPALIANKPWSTDMNSLMDELIAHAPHVGPEYDEDNAMVYTLLMATLNGSQHVASISRFQRTRNGREAYNSLVTHNMGSAKWEKIIEAAEKTLNQRVWNGKNHRYPLKAHIGTQREAYNDMVRASDNIEYDVPNDTTRVRLLLNSITSSDMVSAKNVILADTTKKTDFEQTADYLNLVAPVGKTSNPHHNVSALHATKKRKITVQDRYYKLSEWKSLTEDERETVRQLRKGRKEKQKGKGGNGEKQRIATLQADLDTKNQIIATLTIAAAQNVPTSGKVPALLPPPGYAGGKKKKDRE